jgi:hypothetical protein
MNKFAVITDGIVSNIIVADSLEDAVNLVGFDCVEVIGQTAVSIGNLFDLETGSFNEPPEGEPEVLPAIPETIIPNPLPEDTPTE